MATEFKLPEIGEGTAEGEIIKWLVAVGDEVVEDTPLVEVMTDKATVEIPSPGPGTVVELRAAEGEVVDVGAVILVFGDSGEAAAVAETPLEDDGAVAAAQAQARAELAAETPASAPPVQPWEAPEAGPGRALATPATRRLAREKGIDLLQVEGSGRGGRVMKEDVIAFAERSGSTPTPPAPRTPAPAPPSASRSPAPAAPPSPARESRSSDQAPLEERVPFRGLRRKIADRLVESKRIVPHFTYVEECDVTEIVALRRQAKAIGSAAGVRVTYLPFFIKAMVEALKKHPILNASLDEAAGEVVIKRYYNVGIATDSERGLVVPVVKNADRLSIFELAAEIERLAGDAREGRSRLEDLQDGTITVTSTGNIGGLLATPIINHPEVAILGITAIRKRPVVRDDAIVIRDMVNLSISLDHRVVDGAPGALFMRDLVALLEDPKLQLLGSV